MHALPRGLLEQVEDHVALAPAVPEHRHGAEVQAAGGDEDEVARDAVELEVDDPQVLGALGDLDPQQRLHGTAVRHRVEVVGEVVHPLDDGDDLPVALVLGRLLDAGVDVADDRLDVEHDLALEAGQQAEHPVRRGVVGPHVEGEQLLLGPEEVVALDPLGRLERRGPVEVADLGGHQSVYWVPWAWLYVKSTGSPPTGKSRRCGWPS